MEKEMELKYLKSLAKLYPSVAAASTEIINLQSVLNLPKGTEHFMTDIHGEYEQFFHVLKNGSGSVKKKINEEFGNTLSKKDKSGLATLIYYPELKVDLVEKTEENLEDWYKITLHRLIQICKRVASKYTRAKVRKMLPQDFAYVIEELITEKEELLDKEAYYNAIISTIIRVGSAGAISPQLKVRDVVFGQGSCTDSNYAHQFGLGGTFAPIADFTLLETAVTVARKLGIEPHVGSLLSSDVFYNKAGNTLDWGKMGVLAVEMESAALYCNAAEAGKRALAICTISDSLITGEELPAADRQTTFTQMMEIALGVAVEMEKK